MYTNWIEIVETLQSYVNKNYDKPIGEFINVDIPYSTGNINVYRFNYKNHQYDEGIYSKTGI